MELRLLVADVRWDDTMPRHLFLHIGMQKTGTTALQSFLKTERQALLAQNFFYPDTRSDNRHTLLVRAIGSPLNKARSPRRRTRITPAGYLEGFSDEITELPSAVNRVIVSSEHFAAYPTQDHVQGLHDFLAPLFDQMTVIVFLRRQDAHFASAYTQSLRLGHLDPPDLDQLHDRRYPYDFEKMLGRWADVFGADSIKPRIFERYPGKKFDILEEFAAMCGFTLPEHRAALSRNPSISQAGQEALVLLGQRMQEQSGSEKIYGPEWQRITRAVTMEAQGTGWLPTQEQARAFVARFAKSNEATRARWFPERSALFNDDYSFLPESSAEPDAAAVNVVLRDVVLRILRQDPKRDRPIRGGQAPVDAKEDEEASANQSAAADRRLAPARRTRQQGSASF